MKKLFRKIQYFLAGLYIAIRFGLPLRDTIPSAMDAEEITRDL